VSGDPLRLALDRNAPEDTADYGGTGNPDTARGPDETYCRNCGRLALDHGPARYSIYGACPPKPAEPSVRDRAAEVLAVAIAAWSDENGQGPHYLCDLDGTPTGLVRTDLSNVIADALAAAGLLAGTSKSKAVPLVVASDEPSQVAPIDPDCRRGKHAACSGRAWDEDADALVLCECSCHRAP